MFGWWGTIKENTCMTYTYAIMMIIFVVLEISAGITGFVKKDDVSRVLVNIAQDSMNNWEEDIVQSTWNSLQVKKFVTPFTQ